MLERAVRAARLDVSLYEEVEHDRSYTQEAFLIVIIVSVLGAIGTWVGPDDRNLVTILLNMAVSGLLGWVIWAAVTLVVGTRVFGGTADYGEMLRVLGYAQAPLALAIIPFIGALVGGIWAIVSGVVAVRQGLDLSTGQAVATVLIGVLAIIATVIVIGLLFGGVVGLGAG